MGRHIDMKKHMFRRQLENKLRQRFETEANQLTDQDRQRMALIKPNKVDISKPAPFIPRPSVRRPAAAKNKAVLNKFENDYQEFIAKLRANKEKRLAEQKAAEETVQAVEPVVEETPVVEQPVQAEAVTETVIETTEAPQEEVVVKPKKTRKKKKPVEVTEAETVE